MCFLMSKRGFARVLGSFLMIVGATVLVLVSSQADDVLAESNEEEVTLTGRTVIWERTLEEASSRPLLGHGFASFDSPSLDYIWGVYRPPHAHNSFVQSYFDLGLVGLAVVLLLVFFHLKVGLNYAVTFRRYSYSLFVTFLTFFASLTGVTYGGKPSILLGVLLLLVSVEGRAFRIAH
jgi:O-antigen ligase